MKNFIGLSIAVVLCLAAGLAATTQAFGLEPLADAVSVWGWTLLFAGLSYSGMVLVVGLTINFSRSWRTGLERWLNKISATERIQLVGRIVSVCLTTGVALAAAKIGVAPVFFAYVVMLGVVTVSLAAAVPGSLLTVNAAAIFKVQKRRDGAYRAVQGAPCLCRVDR